MDNQTIEITNMRAIGDKILVLPQEVDETKTAGGIILTQTYDTLKKEVMGTVVSVGEKLQDQIKVGDTVVYQKVYELSVTISGVRHVVLKAGIDGHVIAVSSPE